jgi:hypothetical protein
MFIKKLKPGVFDVFLENGWSKWTRVRRVNDSIRYVSGEYLNRATFAEVKDFLCRK